MNKITKISIWVLVVGAAISLLSFVTMEHQTQTCWNLDIKVHDNNDMLFIDEQSVEKEILNLGDPIIGSKMDDIDIDRIDKALKLVSAVKDVNIYKTLDGQVQVRVTQRTPIARILNKDNSSYYLDEEGQIMDLSNTYTAQVLLVSGNILESGSLGSVNQILDNDRLAKVSILDDVFVLIKTIDEDTFMKSLTDYIYVDENNEFVIIPRIGRQKILVGDNKDLKDKFTNLKSFYKGTINKINIDKYKALSIKFNEQVIGIK